MSNYIVFESKTPGLPFSYRGAEYHFDEFGLYFTREDRTGFVAAIEAQSKVTKGIKPTKAMIEDHSKYKRQTDILEVPKFSDDPKIARSEKYAFCNQYWPNDDEGNSLLSISIHDRDLNDHVDMLIHKSDKERFEYARKIGAK